MESKIIFLVISFLLINSSYFTISSHNLFRKAIIFSKTSEKFLSSDHRIEIDLTSNSHVISCFDWSREVSNGINKFVIFFEFNHCGSTATENIIDAHPNALIANEMLLFDDHFKAKQLFSA